MNNLGGGDVGATQRGSYRHEMREVALASVGCILCGETLWQEPTERSAAWVRRSQAWMRNHEMKHGQPAVEFPREE